MTYEDASGAHLAACDRAMRGARSAKTETSDREAPSDIDAPAATGRRLAI
jgi:hypothetical protein